MSTISGFKAPYTGSNYGASTVKLEKLAPGTDIAMSPGQEETERVQLSGTGFASPLVAGKAALLLSANPNMSNSELKEALVKDSQKEVGAGDVLRNLALLSAGTAGEATVGMLPGALGAPLGATLTSIVGAKNRLAPEESSKIADRMARNTLNAGKSMTLSHFNGGTGGFIPAAMGATTGMWSGHNPVTVAVIGSGADANHPALQGKLMAGSATTDELGSGTHIAGVIADPLGKHYQR